MPRTGAISLGREWGWPTAVAAQLAVLAVIGVILYAAGGKLDRRRLFGDGGRGWLWRGPWPMVMGGLALAVLSLGVLSVAGHPWSVTWGYTLWGAKIAAAAGWDPAMSAFWSGRYASGALDRSLFADNVSLSNFGIVIGALAAAAMAGKLNLRFALTFREIATAVIGGLMLGYGARLAYGCNIGAFLSGVASTSLHGWVWIVAAALGNVVGVRCLRLLHR